MHNTTSPSTRTAFVQLIEACVDELVAQYVLCSTRSKLGEVGVMNAYKEAP